MLELHGFLGLPLYGKALYFSSLRYKQKLSWRCRGPSTRCATPRIDTVFRGIRQDRWRMFPSAYSAILPDTQSRLPLHIFFFPFSFPASGSGFLFPFSHHHPPASKRSPQIRDGHSGHFPGVEDSERPTSITEAMHTLQSLIFDRDIHGFPSSEEFSTLFVLGRHAAKTASIITITQAHTKDAILARGGETFFFLVWLGIISFDSGNMFLCTCWQL